ncbi:MAG: type 4a pilus biogenesis protein PilO [Candidatus Omnitrophica bacterium]|nr:type 4a pilus biogenesis protein PilO [Candidatus Omnitrophota bacterium]MCF7892425.1 type 4a pilus biogenesis protein PilO [Candidatus Omnitrophota bacterium]MCF7897323.1 type 4a pilus biogenesis protein PilO [Candidatus Omnitrophota bacterium]MCF7909958.1 type 4a pilus biogenesis protein PilO [Candidatus Omnitrophota bacterium]
MQKIRLDKHFFIFIILSAALIAELFIFLPWGIGSIAKTGKAVKRLKQKIETTKTEWPKRQDYLVKIDDLKKEIAKNKNKIITSGHESKLISFISKNSQKYNIRIKAITPLDPYPAKNKKFNYIPFRIEAEGGFHDLGNFLAFLQKDNYFFELKELTLAGYRPNKINILLCGLEER